MANSTQSSGNETTREAQAHAIATRVYELRSQGQHIPDEAVVAQHAYLMPELLQELNALRQLKEAMDVADKAGAIDRRIEALPSDEIERPLSRDQVEDAEKLPHPDDRPAIKGFQILYPIGRGGQATVYRAVQESTGRQVALKVITGGAWIDAQHRARFGREVGIMSALDHANIIKVIEHGRVANGPFYFVMEYVDGWSMEEYAVDCAANDPHHPKLLLETLAKVAHAVHAAHEAGVIHRDLKPSNIRVDRHGSPRVLDFGLASSDDDIGRRITTTGQWIGSLPWFSPEQVVEGESHATPQTDVYALGVVAYQALCGSFPYEVRGPVKEVLHRIGHAKPVPPSRRLKMTRRTGKLVDAVILKALAKSRTNRYRRARMFGEDLEAISSGSRPQSARLPYSRVIGGIAILSILASAVFLTDYFYHPAPAPGAELPHFTNSAGMTFVEIGPGSFYMGSPPSEPGRSSAEVAHFVTLTRPYWLATTEVTQRQYAVVMGKKLPANGAELPVSKMSWAEAEAFCARLSAREHRQYRLPTEAEWEYACRTGQVSNLISLNDCAWYAGTSKGELHAVASKPSNAWGLFDMLGNASEWCQDGPRTFLPGNAVDPVGPKPESINGVALLKGGDCRSTELNCRAASRFESAFATRFSGFRVAVDPADGPPTESPK